MKTPALCAIALMALCAVDATPPWKEILGPTYGKLPKAGASVVIWRTNLVTAMAEAREQRLSA